MPCWFYDKRDLLNTPSVRDGISPETEAWYRKEGAKHIMDAGNKLGLRFDTCATGVVYFHRFYMFHSFKEFHQLVTAACCLFLAGKVEETPKKCKDIIKTFRSMLNDAQFAHFGEDPKEEVMTLERILLQTIKFDLMVEHPYAYLLKFAKLVKGDKTKIQKMVQMAWTFINDSLCTTLCLLWEPEIIAVAVMYLTSRLNKFDIVDWQGKPSGFRGKWYEFLVEDVTLDLLEDICHQVLDLYSNTSQPQKDVTKSPVPVKTRQPPLSSDDDQSRTPRTPKSPHGVKRPAPNTSSNASGSQPTDGEVAPPAAKDRERITTHVEAQSSSHRSSGALAAHQGAAVQPAASVHPVASQGVPVSSSFSTSNPYMPTQMYSSSFMSTEGSQSIQSLMGSQNPTVVGRDDPSGSGQASQVRSSNYSSSAAGIGYQQQQYASQQYSSTPSSQGLSAVGSAVGSHRSDQATAAAVNYRATSAATGYTSSGSSSASYNQQQQYAGYQQSQSAQQSVAESVPGYGGAAFLTGSTQSQFPPLAAAAAAQSTSPVYQSYSGSRGGLPLHGVHNTTAGSQQQRYASGQSMPAANSAYQSHAASGASFPSQQSSSTTNYQGHSSGGYQSRVASSSAGFSSQQPSATGSSYHQTGQQGYHSREQSGGSNYHGQQSGYQQQASNVRSGGSGGQQQGNSSSRSQNWEY